jgi:hypothetical protein
MGGGVEVSIPNATWKRSAAIILMILLIGPALHGQTNNPLVGKWKATFSGLFSRNFTGTDWWHEEKISFTEHGQLIRADGTVQTYGYEDGKLVIDSCASEGFSFVCHLANDFLVIDIHLQLSPEEMENMPNPPADHDVIVGIISAKKVTE